MRSGNETNFVWPYCGLALRAHMEIIIFALKVPMITIMWLGFHHINLSCHMQYFGSAYQIEAL